MSALSGYHFQQSHPLDPSKIIHLRRKQSKTLLCWTFGLFNERRCQLIHYSAAIIHYGPEKGRCAVIDPNRVYLCDSGAQYLDGTTDTTRTLHFGSPGAAIKQAYTLVLKGLISLHTAVFPKGTTGFALDCLARQFLWVCNQVSDMFVRSRRRADS